VAASLRFWLAPVHCHACCRSPLALDGTNKPTRSCKAVDCGALSKSPDPQARAFVMLCAPTRTIACKAVALHTESCVSGSTVYLPRWPPGRCHHPWRRGLLLVLLRLGKQRRAETPKSWGVLPMQAKVPGNPEGPPGCGRPRPVQCPPSEWWGTRNASLSVSALHRQRPFGDLALFLCLLQQPVLSYCQHTFQLIAAAQWFRDAVSSLFDQSPSQLATTSEDIFVHWDCSIL